MGPRQREAPRTAAIFFDATIVRSILAPATMKVMGNWNWYLPNRVRRILGLEPAPGAAPTFEVGVERRGEIVHVELSGELDIDTKVKLKAELARVEAGRPRMIVIDLRRLEFMDSMGLGVLLGALRRSRIGGWRLVLVKGPEPIEQLLLITGVKNLVEVVDDPEAAGNGGGRSESD